MSEKDKILVGKIVGPQGLRGDVRVQTYTQSPTDLRDMKMSVGANENSPVNAIDSRANVVRYAHHSYGSPSLTLGLPTHTHSPLQDSNPEIKFVRAVPNSDIVIMKIAGVDDRNAAESLRGTPLFIDRDALPPLAPNEYYQADLIGMRVIPRLGRGGRANGADGVGAKTLPAAFGGTPPEEGNYVVAVQNYGAGDILELDNGEMVSFIGAKVDLEKREIIL